jgi:ERCC4 domain
VTDRTRVFVVVRNPEVDSKLPYLLWLPLEGGLVLKARESWPATARVYCHRFEQAWPEQAELIERTPVLLCRRRGAAIDLVLDRHRLARSQFVFTQVKGREAIFWQTQKTARSASPGGRIPRRRTLAGAVTIAIDTRERYPYRFAQQGADTVRETVPAGDYAIQAPDGSLLAAVERKSLENLAATLSDGTLDVDDACEILDSLPNLTEALAAAEPELRRRVFDAFRLAVALDRNAGQIRVKALISSAFTNTRDLQNLVANGAIPGVRYGPISDRSIAVESLVEWPS